jgi:4-hydroxyphenylpyruvate dioxygenase-like putative hemolysin
MRPTKSPFSAATNELPLNGEHAEQQLALEYLAEAWNVAEDEGIDHLALAHASLFAALATLVRAHGDEMTADIVAALPERIRAGEYNLDRSLQ